MAVVVGVGVGLGLVLMRVPTSPKSCSRDPTPSAIRMCTIPSSYTHRERERTVRGE